ncbi:MAG: M20/M25/M40 family metallo-hydrolase [Chloroflexota bacterium]
MPKRNTFSPWLVLTALLSLVTLACTLSQASAPPTLVPRQTAPPIPTIGYATLAPQSLPQQASPVATPPPGSTSATAIQAMVNRVESDRLMRHVRNLTGFYTRHVNSPQNRTDYGIGAARNYIYTEFEAIQAQTQGNLAVFQQEFSLEWNGVRTQQTNVVAIVGGTQIGAGTIIVGAHYDSRGDDDTDATAYAPGANDNGTGVAALLEMARIVADQPHRSTVVFVAFSAEEVGRKGSIAFVDGYVNPNIDNVLAYVNVDAIGSQTYSDGTVSDRQLRVFSQGPNETSVSRQVARMANLIAFNYVPEMEIVVQDALDRPGRYGDHFSFEEAGYPSVRFIEMAENSSYLDTTDTIEGINPNYFLRTTQTILAVVSSMANGPQPPRNISLRENGDGTRTLIWEDTPGATSYVVALRQPNSMIYQQFETSASSVVWDGFTSTNFTGIAVAAVGNNGLMGPLSQEIGVP